MEAVKRLRELLAEGTKRPWRVSMSGYSIKSEDPDVPIVAAVHGGASATQSQLEAWLRNGDLIVAIVNAGNALLDVVEAAKSLREKNGIVCFVSEETGRIEFGPEGSFRFIDGKEIHDADCPGCRLIAALAKVTP